jgi:hypothetical protein
VTAPLTSSSARAPTGPEQNERLTHRAAVVLVVLLAVEGLTLLAMHQLLRVHMFVGLVLIPPVLLKLASTGYRFVRYYTRSAPYREKGPPQLLLRAMAPLLVLATVAVLGSGVWLMLLGRRSGWVLELHKVSFIVWAVFFGVHFLAYVPRVAHSLLDELHSRRSAASAAANAAALAMLGLGVGAALLLLPEIRGWISLR